jgi:predicted secreted protein
MADARSWPAKLRDERSGKVVFLSHCLLNENTRYLGGACRPGAIEEVVRPCLARGLGIIQMPCPEQIAWGGVLKRRLLWLFGSEGRLIYRLRKVLLPILVWATRRVYSRTARQVADQIADYEASGFTIVGVVGVDGSPSCGVHQTLEIMRALQLMSQLRPEARAADMNAIVQACLTPGRGIFVEQLHKELLRRGFNVPFLAHDLIAELQGRPVPLSL